MRCTQGIFSGAAHPAPPCARGELYVDDPIFSIVGTRQERDRMITKIVLAWRLLGFPVSFAKARRGLAVVWIGALLTSSTDAVFVSIPAAKVAEFLAMVEELLLTNVVPIKTLRRLAGLACHFASLIFIWRPFLSELWGAILSFDNDLPTRAPYNCVWTKRIVGTSLVPRAPHRARRIHNPVLQGGCPCQSRLVPGVVFVLPPMPRAAREAHPPSRSPHWWRS